MTSGVDKVKTAVNTRVLDVAVAHGSKLFAEIGAVLVLDILDDRVPAAKELALGDARPAVH